MGNLASLREKTLINSLNKGNKLINLELGDLDKLLTVCAKMVGVKNENQPDKEEQVFLMRTVTKYFGNLSDEQVRTAFELYASGKLLAEEHYQSFNFKFISSILNSYITEVNNAINFYQSKLEDKPKPKEVKQEVDWSETYEFLIGETIIENKNMIIPVYLYDWLLKTNTYLPTKEQKEHALKVSKKVLINRHTKEWQDRPTRNGKLFIEELEKAKQGDKVYKMIIDEAKKYLIKQHLENVAHERKTKSGNITEADKENTDGF